MGESFSTPTEPFWRSRRFVVRVGRGGQNSVTLLVFGQRLVLRTLVSRERAGKVDTQQKLIYTLKANLWLYRHTYRDTTRKVPTLLSRYDVKIDDRYGPLAWDDEDMEDRYD
jgi:hypothetical protein